ncbi:MAG: HD domain-containing protein [Syntrophomonadaceae bacterium]|jgi:hypothetical protein
MENRTAGDFVLRQGLIPLRDLANSPLKPDGFDLARLQAQIEAQGLKVDNFYYNPHESSSPYYYYRGMVLLAWEEFDQRLAAIKSRIEAMEQALNAMAIKRDFAALLAAVDRRLAPDLYVEVFHMIPDHDKYRLFEAIWQHNPYSGEVFDRDFIAQVSKYRGVSSILPAAAEDGYVEVFRCENQPPQGEEVVSTWSTDVNIAISQALHCEKLPTIYQGRVQPEHIVSYDGDRREVLVKGDRVERRKALALLDLRDLLPELTEAGIMRQYHGFAQQIDSRWFHNPQGVHGIRHTERVLLLSLIIAYLERYSEADRELLGLAAIYHDIGRVDDGYDPDHGLSSYAKFVQAELAGSDDEERETLRFIIENHAIPDHRAYNKIGQYQLADQGRAWRLFMAFKDADGLDRVRLNNLKPQYLRTASAHRLLLAAHQLYRQSQ